MDYQKIYKEGKQSPTIIRKLLRKELGDEKFIELIENLEGISFSEWFYQQLHPHINPTCPVCTIKKCNFISLNKGYSLTCSTTCSAKDPRKQEKRKQAYLKKFGVSNPFKSEEVKKKIQETNIKKYGVAHNSHNKDTLLKRRETYIEKYGVDNPMKNGEVKKKVVETNMKKYWSKSPLQNKQVQDKINKTIVKKYGVSNVSQSREVQQKVQSTFLLKHGGHPMKNTDIKKKIQETNTKKYWSNSPFWNEKIKQKAQITMQEKYKGHPMKSLDILEKRKNKSLEKYGTPYPSQSKEVQEKRNKEFIREYGTNIPTKKDYIRKYKEQLKEYVVFDPSLEKQIEEYFIGEKDSLKDLWNFTCKSCGNKFRDSLRKKGNNLCIIPPSIPRCPICYPKKKGLQEAEIFQFIESLGYTPESWNRKVLEGRELDIYVKEKNLALEFNGLMYHSFGIHANEVFNTSWQEPIKKKYHLEKTILCEQKGVHLLHIFENEWLNPVKRDIWKSIISGKLHKNSRIYARKLILDTEVPSWEAKQFLEENHLQRSVVSSIRIWLRNSNWELLCVMTFGRSRYGKKYTYELLRLASKKYTTIVGAASKLLSYFKKNILKDGESLVSYADRRYSNGNVYEQLGLEYVGSSKPNYFYFKNNSWVFYSRVSFQKHKLKDKLESFDESLTETQNMYNNGYRKIYDCGNRIYILS